MSRRTQKIYYMIAAMIGSACVAQGGEAPVELGKAGDYVGLAATTLTATNGGTYNGDVGVWPGTAITGFPPAICTGSIEAGTAPAQDAQTDLLTAYNDAAGRSNAPITVAGNLGGQTLPPGLYKSTSTLAVSSGDLTLDAGGDSTAVWIFQVASAFDMTADRKMILAGGAQASNIFWQVGSSATFGTTAVVKGNILALESISFNTGASLEGKALARQGAVTMDGNEAIANPENVLPPDLIISEVVEGTDANFKYVEILNASTTQTVDLSFPQIILKRFTDGGVTSSPISLSGTIAPGGYFVIANNQVDLDAVYGLGVITASQTHLAIDHDGDDSYELYHGDVVIDGFSKDWVTGSDPGAPAVDGTFFRVNSALPNNGNWGGTDPVADGGLSASGFWKRALITALNENGETVTTPFASGGGGDSSVSDWSLYR